MALTLSVFYSALALLLVSGMPEMAPDQITDQISSGVSLSEHKASFEPETKKLLLELSPVNHLDATLSEVEIGILVGDSPENLEICLAKDAYQTEGGCTGVISKRKIVEIYSDTSDPPVQIALDLSELTFSPAAFRTHLLGYQLLKPSAELLLSLVAGKTVADERAALYAMGLGYSVKRRESERRNWQASKRSLSAWMAEINKEIPSKPNEIECARRIFALMSLGVVGDKSAEPVILGFAQRQGAGRFDEALQVLRLGALVGNQLVSPLGVALPPRATSIRDIARISARALVDLSAFPSIQERVEQAESEAEIPFESVENTEPPRERSLLHKIALVALIVIFSVGFLALLAFFKTRL